MKFKHTLTSKTLSPSEGPIEFNVIDGVTGFSSSRVAIYAAGIKRPLLVLDRVIYDQIAQGPPDEIISMLPGCEQQQSRQPKTTRLTSLGSLAQHATLKQTPEMALNEETEVIARAKNRKNKGEPAEPPKASNWDSSAQLD